MVYTIFLICVSIFYSFFLNNKCLLIVFYKVIIKGTTATLNHFSAL